MAAALCDILGIFFAEKTRSDALHVPEKTFNGYKEWDYEACIEKQIPGILLTAENYLYEVKRLLDGRGYSQVMAEEQRKKWLTNAFLPAALIRGRRVTIEKAYRDISQDPRFFFDFDRVERALRVVVEPFSQFLHYSVKPHAHYIEQVRSDGFGKKTEQSESHPLKSAVFYKNGKIALEFRREEDAKALMAVLSGDVKMAA